MSGPLFWLDVETTDLDPRHGSILEIAVSRADFDRPFQAVEIYHAVLRYSREARVWLEPFIINMHTKNGLLDECEQSVVSLDSAEQDLLKIVPEVADKEDRPILAGSTIHFDKSFLEVHMPLLAKRFSHRLYDASAIKLFCQSLGMPKPPKAEAHRARDDVRESIAHAKACAEWLGRLR